MWEQMQLGSWTPYGEMPNTNPARFAHLAAALRQGQRQAARIKTTERTENIRERTQRKNRANKKEGEDGKAVRCENREPVPPPALDSSTTGAALSQTGWRGCSR